MGLDCAHDKTAAHPKVAITNTAVNLVKLNPLPWLVALAF
jgi:hypothetical protein